MKVSDLRLSHLAAAATVVVVGAVLFIRTPGAAGASDPASSVAVNCETGQQALVRQTVVNGEPRVAIQCAGPALAQQIAHAEAYGGALPLAAPIASPAVYYAQPAAPLRTQSAPAASGRVASRPAGTGRSWQKTALVIGGSSGAGAGIGGLAGGRKGALIGAAIGGGGAALYEATRRR